jgi:hypothetical protein
MFWPRITGRKLPGIIIGLVVLAALFATPGAQARPRFRNSTDAFRFRLSGSLGYVDYDDISRASNGRTQFLSAPQMGYRLEGEKWIPRDIHPWPLFGLGAEVENFPLRLFGRPMAYTSGGGGVVWRASGSSQKSWSSDELVLSAAVSVQAFPDVRGYPKSTILDPHRPDLLGFKGGFRYGHSLSRKWHMDAGAYWIAPLSLYNAAGAELSKSETRSFGATMLFDYSLSWHLDIGLGVLFQSNRLVYRPLESAQPQSVQWNNYAPFLSIQFWFDRAAWYNF